jgi:hypothetical protein
MKMNKGLEFSWTLNSRGLHVALNIEALCQQWLPILKVVQFVMNPKSNIINQGMTSICNDHNDVEVSWN